MMKYNPQEIEPKWIQQWDEMGLYEAVHDPSQEKRYYLVEFPYPSGMGLHVGHVWGYTMADVLSRKSRMQGKNVLFPMGWDAFGLPTENYAIKTGVSPQEATAKNVATFKSQMKKLGFSFDWSKEVNTTDPDYYKWTQWIFLKLFEKGLAYEQEMPINWCNFCKTGLAHEEVTNENTHERCDTPVTKKMVKQWLLKITAYADQLIEGLETIDFSEDIKQQQINWIGRSEGAKITFEVKEKEANIQVYTTRADTLPGVTYMVLAPEHPLVSEVTVESQEEEVKQYIEQALQKSELERAQLQKEKTGVFTGSYAINPLTNEEVPIWISDYVLVHYGTGAVMGVPGHDERDHAFAQAHELPVIEVEELGDAAIENIVNTLAQKNVAEIAVEYKLRDWIFSRQHYWGEPIPIIHCEQCGVVPEKVENLPIVLPPIDDFEPGEDGSSPLARVRDWVEVKCPSCGGQAERETDTMPNWAGSSWYFLRYCDPSNKDAFADSEKLSYFLPVDLYIGGPEHTTLHLLYSRFWHQFLFDEGLVPTHEPYQARRNRGMILGPDSKKMSKSKGNVINPDDEVAVVGADTLRMYELFIGPYDGTFPWDPQAEKGVYRFLERVWEATNDVAKLEFEDTSEELAMKLNQTIKKVSEDIDQLKFNTAIAAMMECLNLVYDLKFHVSKDDWYRFLQILAPFAPFMTEELKVIYYGDKTGDSSIHSSTWPSFDEKLIQLVTFELPVQVNGKLRGTIGVASEDKEDEDKLVTIAKENDNVQEYLKGKDIRKVIFVPGKMINFVVS